MDPRSGDLLAMANWPSVDANRVEDEHCWVRLKRRGRVHIRARLDLQVVHRCRRTCLQEGRPPRDSHFGVGPQIQVADRTIKEAHGTGGIFTVSDILARSSNVGAVRDRTAAR